MKKKILTMAVATILVAGYSWADVLILRDGTRHDGRFISGNRNTVSFQHQNGRTRNYPVRDVQSVQFQTAVQSSTALGQAADGAVTQANAARTIPAGTELAIRTNENIDTNTASEGRSYSGEVSRAVVDSAGNMIVPQGANAELVVRQISEPGAVGTAELTVDVQSIAFGGQRYLVSADPVTRKGDEGIGINQRTGKYVGAGAALGTLLGAIAGGGKGAAIGALAGAAAGAGAQVLTRGKEVKVPAETILTFKLDQPIYLQPAG
jgi:hypothetical protein